MNLAQLVVERKTEIKDLETKDDGTINIELIQAEKDLEDLPEEEGKYWKIHSREDWLRWGDNNTKWFHNKANQRRKRNEIKGIMDDHGRWDEDEEKIGDIATNYFKKLFTSSSPTKENMNEVLKGVKKAINDEDNNNLSKRFTKADIQVALKSMNPTKAPGIDGMHALFFQNYWDIVGEDTSKICLDILNGCSEIGPLNKTLIALIPKTKRPKEMINFRPISLCSVIYKLIAKTLANWMKQVMDKVIAPSQAAFVPNRLISDYVILGFECINHLNNRRKGKKDFIAMKLDMNKAYDRVEWIFIRRIMSRMGFSTDWIEKVMKCIESVQFSVLINGNPGEKFKTGRGIRQGDPLSPYIFLLCAEGFSAMLSREESLNSFSGLKINRYCPSLTHLFFADDSIVFCGAEEKDCYAIKRILEAYKSALGQSVNLSKSSYMVSKNVSKSKVENLSKILGIQKAEDLGYYLGMPSQTGRNKNKIFKKLKERIWKVLQSWKSKLFSVGGK